MCFLQTFHRNLLSLSVVCFAWTLCAFASADDAAPFRESLAKLQAAQRALADGKPAEAKAACTALLKMDGAAAHHRWEAQSVLNEIERTEKGLPARDPIATRVTLPQRPKPGAVFYVAPDGDDANPGDKGRPFLSLEKARDAVRGLKASNNALPSGGVDIRLRSGEYRIAQTFVLEEKDSGTEQSPVVYRAEPGETVQLHGGIRITGFQPVRDDTILARLPKESQGKTLCADLKPLGVHTLKPLELGGFSSGRGFVTHPTQELFFDGRAMTLARWPNEGFATTGELVRPEKEPGDWGYTYSKTGAYRYQGDRPARWAAEPEPWLYGYWYFDWADSYEKVASIDTAKREITLAPPAPKYGFRKDQMFRAVNLLSELDQPGEWWLDRKNCVVYFWPPADVKKATVELSLLDAPLIELRKASHVTLEGLVCELAGGDAVRIKGGSHCLLAGCTVRRCGGDGVVVQGGTDHGILSCDIYSLGRGAIRLAGGSRKTLAPGRHFVENCHIHELSRIDRTYTPGVVVEGVGNRIAHNYFHDIASSAMRVGGNDHLVEYNETCRVVLESNDQGGVDMYGNPTYRGNVFRYNYWHHIGHWQHPDGIRAGIRFDDAISGSLVYGNVFWHASSGAFGGVQIHGGKDNVLDNNLFVDCESAISQSAWGAARWKQFVTKALESPEIDRDLFIKHYPGLATLTQQCDRNTIARSVAYRCKTFIMREGGHNEQFDNMQVQSDPGLRDAAKGDFGFTKASAAVRQIGFRPIPFEEIGLYVDAYRTSLSAKRILGDSK
jgi:hypothetical protein